MVTLDEVPFAFRWLGAAGFQLRFGAIEILIDPFLGGVTQPLRSQDALPKLELTIQDLAADAVFVTHGHFDHACDVPAIALHTRAPVYASSAVCQILHDAGVPARQLHSLAAGRRCEVGNVEVLAIASRHVRFDLPLVWRVLGRVLAKPKEALALLRKARGWPMGEVLAYRFATLETSVVHLGSAGWIQNEWRRIDPAGAKIHRDGHNRPYVVLLPLQGRSDIYRVAFQMLEMLYPTHVIPHHYDDALPPVSEQIALRPFFELVRERLPGGGTQPPIEMVEPRIGEWMQLC